jgi:hypothetical protein
MFDDVPISTAMNAESEIKPSQCSGAMQYGIDEKDRVVDVLLVAEFAQK